MAVFLAWFTTYAAGPVLAAVAVGGLLAAYVLHRVQVKLDRAIDVIGDITYEQTGGVRNTLREHLDEKADHIVERVETTTTAQHEQTRRALEYPPAYTGSGATAIPTTQSVSDGYRRSAAPTGNGAAVGAAGSRQARQVPVRSPWDHPTPPRTPPRGATPPSAPPPEARRAENASAVIGDQLAAERDRRTAPRGSRWEPSDARGRHRYASETDEYRRGGL